MFWEVSGISTEVIGLLWNLPFLEYSTGLFFLGLFLSLIVPSESLSFFCSCLSDSALVSVNNTQDKTPPVPGSTIKYDFFCTGDQNC